MLIRQKDVQRQFDWISFVMALILLDVFDNKTLALISEHQKNLKSKCQSIHVNTTNTNTICILAQMKCGNQMLQDVCIASTRFRSMFFVRLHFLLPWHSFTIIIHFKNTVLFFPVDILVVDRCSFQKMYMDLL